MWEVALSSNHSSMTRALKFRECVFCVGGLQNQLLNIISLTKTLPCNHSVVDLFSVVFPPSRNLAFLTTPSHKINAHYDAPHFQGGGVLALIRYHFHPGFKFSKYGELFDEWKTNLMSLAILFRLLCAQHVSDINISIFRSLRLCWWITTSVVLFSVRCVLELLLRH